MSDSHSPKQAIDFAAFAAGLAMPIAGRGRDFEPIAARCRSEQKATDGMIRVMVRYCDVLALTYAGELDLADQRAADYEEFSSAGQFLGWAIAKITSGLVATHRGRFPEAISSIEQALAALAAEMSLPWRLPARLLLARAYAAMGSIDEAERVLADAKEHSGEYVAIHRPHLLIAKVCLAVLAGLGRASAEVGAVMIVGGNIDGVTRVMTTTIALETSKGDLPLALALGLVLIAIVLLLNAAAQWIREWARVHYG